MKLPIQVEAIVYRESGNATGSFIGGRWLEFLALHRTPDRGGFWQPLTGGVEDFDANLSAAVVREVGEELQVEPNNVRSTHQLDYSFSFPDDKGVVLTEHTFGVEIDSDSLVTLSDEHDDRQWGAAPEIANLFVWEDNKQALSALIKVLEARDI